MKRFLILLLAFSCCFAFGQETGCTFELADNYDAGAIVDDGSCTFGGGVYIDPVVVSTALFDPCGGDGFLRDESIVSTNWNYEAYRLALTNHIENVGFGRVFVVEMHQEVLFPEFDGYGFNYDSFPNPAWDVSCNYSAFNAEWIPSVTIAFSNPCIISPCLGCADPTALNFETSASIDDGSCVYSSDACGEGTIWDSISQTCIVDDSACGWQPDSNDDGLVGVGDLLDFLVVYGDEDVDQDGVWDSGDLCVDTSACNYAQNPSLDCAYLDILGVCGGGCEADEDADGICDDVDDCVGILDECGVCNGPGPTEIVIEDISILYDSVYLSQLDEWYVYEYGADTTFSYTCAPYFGECGDPVSYQGYDYATVLIGDQCWFAENLRSENYENGDAIPYGNFNELTEDNPFIGCIYETNNFYGCTIDFLNQNDTSQVLNAFGRYYNWWAVVDARGVCPSGWHVSTDADWLALETFIGMPEIELFDLGNRGSVEANSLMSQDYWNLNGGTNSTGFDGRPGGGISSQNFPYTCIGHEGVFWTSTYYMDLFIHGPILRSINSSETITRWATSSEPGLSVRCVQDNGFHCATINESGNCGSGCYADIDLDGICDDIDDCVGEYDECGTCNGTGAILSIDEIVVSLDSVVNPMDSSWSVFPISIDTTFVYDCPPSFDECGDPVSYQGYDYSTILIGEQCWFSENLRANNYRNGDAISIVDCQISWDEWYEIEVLDRVATYGEGQCFCESESPNGDACNPDWSLQEYGRLYNWFTTKDPRGLCPSGWHVSTDEDWKSLEMSLGMSELEADGMGLRGTNQGNQLKADYGWQGNLYDGNGNNASGFSALPGGGNTMWENWTNAGKSGYWWSTHENGFSSILRGVFALTNNEFYWEGHSADGDVGIYRAAGWKPRLNYIRCVQN